MTDTLIRAVPKLLWSGISPNKKKSGRGSMNKLRKLFAPMDMTEGRPWEKIILFMIPMLIGNIAQQLYNTVDSIIVGKYVGDTALAAVGSAGPILNLLVVLFVGISMGASIVVAQYMGARQREALSRSIGNCLILTAIASVIVMVMAVFLTRPLLVLLDTPDSIIEWCNSYLLIMLLGAAGMAYYNMLSGILQGLGDSVSALFYLLVASGLNIVLDLLFVAVFQMGVNGVAYATVISQIISALFCLRKLSSMQDMFDLKMSHIKWKKKYAAKIIRVGIPSGLTQAILSMTMLAVQSLTNSFGENLIAANVIIMRVDGFAILPGLSFGVAMTTYAGQNVGAGRYDRVEKGALQGSVIAAGVSTAVTALILAFGRSLMSVFTDTVQLVDMGVRFMGILAVGYIFFSVTQCLCGIMRGGGDAMATMWVSIVATFAVRLPLAYIMVALSKSEQYPVGKPESLYFSQLAAWLFGTVFTFILYKKGKWKEKAIGTIVR